MKKQGIQQPKLKFQVRAAFDAEVLPFFEDAKSFFKNINDNIPIVSTLEKSKGFQKRNFGKAPSKSYNIVDSVNHTVELTIGEEKVLAFEKIIHLIDAYRRLRYNEGYNENLVQLWGQFDNSFMNNANNQAYVDIASSFLASSIAEQLGSPHFVKFYQAFRSLPDTYKWHITEDIASYRYTKWFWAAYDQGFFKLEVREKGSNALLTDEEVLQLLRPDPDLCCDSDDESDESDDNESQDNDSNSDIKSEYSIKNDEEIPELSKLSINEENVNAELESVGKISCEDGPAEIIYRHNSRAHTVNKDNESEETEFDLYVIHAVLTNVPVIVMHTELMSGNMDELLLGEEFEDEWEQKWTAWLWQVIVGLYQLQKHYNLIHNDLHTNNILWKETEEEYFTYKTTTGQIFKVPTYGKRFAVIDYGRATFLFNGVEVSSSDFRDGADAEGQYNFGPWRNKNKPILRPNPSFDLCRLSCSLTRILFPQNPEQKKNGSIMSYEDGQKFRETHSELFNMLWTWLVDSENQNILEEADGSERFPGFDLYQHIAAHCRKAKPEDWIQKPIFEKFKVKSVDASVKVINI